MNEKEFLNQYDSKIYEKPSVTVDTLIFTVDKKNVDNVRKLPEQNLQILLIKRKGFPYKDMWAIPGGFVNMKENLDEAAHRELKEETGIDVGYMEQLYTWGDINRDPRTRVISASYMALIDKEKVNILAGDDASDVQWFNIKLITDEVVQKNSINNVICDIKEKHEMLILFNEKNVFTSKIKTIINYDIKSVDIIEEKSELAFDHAKIIKYGIDRLRNKIEYTDIVFNLMPEFFTLTELQQVYETILNKELLKANFRRKVFDMVVETNQLKINKAHRPSKLFKFNKNFREGV